MREHSYITFCALDSRDDTIDSRLNLFRTFATGTAVFENYPVGSCRVNLLRGQSLIVAVIPLHKIRINLGAITETRERTCFSCAPQRAR